VAGFLQLVHDLLIRCATSCTAAARPGKSSDECRFTRLTRAPIRPPRLQADAGSRKSNDADRADPEPQRCTAAAIQEAS